MIIYSTTNAISQTQQELIDEEENIYLSYNSDKEIGFNLRYDNCHYNFEGQITASKKISNSIINIIGILILENILLAFLDHLYHQFQSIYFFEC